MNEDLSDRNKMLKSNKSMETLRGTMLTHERKERQQLKVLFDR